MPTFTAAQLAQQLGGEVAGDASTQLTGFAPADHARAGDLTFAENETYLAKAEESQASAVLVPPTFSSSKKTLIRVANPRVGYARVLPLFFPEARPAGGIHPSAVVARSSHIDPAAHIGPHCVVGERAKIGAHSVLLGGNHVGDDAALGEDVWLFPNVVIYPRSQLGNRVRIHAGTVIGSDGFGYVLDEGQHRKILQVGNVIIHDDVEIGSNTSIDRAALGSTVIGRGTKIDNLVQIGHNVVIGEHSVLVAQVAIAGSSKLGNYVVIGGQAGIAGHLTIGDHVAMAAQSGLMHNIPAGEKWWGTPAQPDRETKRQILAMRRLPELLKRVAELERKLAELSKAPSNP